MREGMLAGDLYIADDPQLAVDRLRAMRLLEQFNRSAADASEERQRLLRELLGTLGDGGVIRPSFYCDYGYQTRLGARRSSTSGWWRSTSRASRSVTTCRSDPMCSC